MIEIEPARTNVETLTVVMIMLSGTVMAEWNMNMKTSLRMRKLAKETQVAKWTFSKTKNQTVQWSTERGRTSHNLNKFGT